MAVAGDAAAVIGATGEDGSAGGRADGSAGVEAVEAQAVRGHGIEVRSFEDGVTVVTGFSPALVIGHDEDDIGALRGRGQREDCSKNESEDFVEESGHEKRGWRMVFLGFRLMMLRPDLREGGEHHFDQTFRRAGERIGGRNSKFLLVAYDGR